MTIVEMAVQGDAVTGCGSLGHGQRYTQDCVGAEVGLVGGAVHIYEAAVYIFLIAGWQAAERRGNAVVHVGYRFQYAFPPEPRLIAVTKLDSFVSPGASS